MRRLCPALGHCPEHIVQIGLADRQLLSVPGQYDLGTCKADNAASGYYKKGPEFHQDHFCGAEGARTLDLRRDRPAF